MASSKDISSSSSSAPSQSRKAEGRYTGYSGPEPDVMTQHEASIFDKMISYAKNAVGIASTTIEATGQVLKSSAEVVGMNMEKLEGGVNQIKKLAKAGTTESGRALAKANRMAKRRIDTDADGGLKISDYYQVLSCTGTGTLGQGMEKKVAADSKFHKTFELPSGESVVWKAQVKAADILFYVREVSVDGSKPAVLFPPTRYSLGTLYEGTIPSKDYRRTVEMVFDNTGNKENSRYIVFWADMGPNVNVDGVVPRSTEYRAADQGPSE